MTDKLVNNAVKNRLKENDKLKQRNDKVEHLYAESKDVIIELKEKLEKMSNIYTQNVDKMEAQLQDAEADFEGVLKESDERLIKLNSTRAQVKKCQKDYDSCAKDLTMVEDMLQETNISAKDLQHANEDRGKLRAKLKIAQDALEFYGDEDGYIFVDSMLPNEMQTPPTIEDGGKRAREALERIK